MRVIVEREALLSAVSNVARFAIHNGNVLILKNIKIEVGKRELRLSATNLDTLAIATMPSDTSEVGSMTVQARLFSEILRRTPEGSQIRLSTGEEGNSLLIEAGRSKVRILTLPIDDFPNIESKFEDGVSFSMQGHGLQKLLRRVAFASPGLSGSKLFHAGVYFHIVGKRLCLAATDSNLLAAARYDCPQGAEKMPGIIVHADLCKEIDRMAGDAGEYDVRFRISGKQIAVEYDGLCLQSKLIDAVFPDYEAIIAQRKEAATHRVVAPTNDMLQSFERCGSLALIEGEKKTYHRGVSFGVSTGKLSISKRNHQLGATDDEIECTYEGEGITIGLNHEYMEGILRAAGSESISLQLESPEKPVVIHPEGNEDVTFFVAPCNAS